MSGVQIRKSEVGMKVSSDWFHFDFRLPTSDFRRLAGAD